MSGFACHIVHARADVQRVDEMYENPCRECGIISRTRDRTEGVAGLAYREIGKHGEIIHN